MATIKHPLTFAVCHKAPGSVRRRANQRVTQVTGVGSPYAPELQIGLSADRESAVEFYQDFLTSWKDTDPDIPFLIAAMELLVRFALPEPRF
jgi:hypothetical protein